MLGDIIYLIRFPVIDSEEFIKSVSPTEILTHVEALNLILLMKGSKPREESPFPVRRRQGHTREIVFHDLMVDQQRIGLQLSQNFFVQDCKSNILISSILLLNDSQSNFPFNNVMIGSTVGTIQKLGGRVYDNGGQLYEVTFNPPVTMRSGGGAVVRINMHQQDAFNTRKCFASRLRGQNTINAEDVTISMHGSPWYFLVGFKYKLFHK